MTVMNYLIKIELKNGVDDLKFISHQVFNKWNPNIQGTKVLFVLAQYSHVLMQSMIGEIEK